MIKPIGGLLVVGALSLFAMPSHASLYCSEGDATEGITESNMTYDSAAASDCYGVVTGNINDQTDLDGLIGDVWGTVRAGSTWSRVMKLKKTPARAWTPGRLVATSSR